MISLNLELPPMSQVVKERRARQRRLNSARRTYAAAQFNRLTNDFVSQRTSANAELRRGLRTLRARSRELSRNDDYIKKFLSLVASNVAGPAGIRLQVKVKNAQNELDAGLAKKVQDAFLEWAHKETASASGKLSWIDAQRLFIRTIARDGEVMVRKIVADNPFGFSLKFIDVDWLDETYNALLPNGNRILMSVEVDQHGRPVAYHLTPPAYDYLYPEHAGMRQRIRVDASEIIHCFLVQDDEEQTRGVPWAHTAMLRLQILGGYEEAELVAARVGACKGVYLVPPEEDEESGLEEDERRPQIEESLQPGTSVELPPGYTVESVSPDHPNANYSGFIKAVLRGISSGLDVSYVSLASDLEGVNYSSIRAGLLDERDIYRALQGFCIEHFCRPVFLAWLKSAILSGAIEGVRARDFDRLKGPKWQPRGWAWVDPLKDITATVLALNNGLDSRTDSLNEQGEEVEHVFKNLADEQALAEKYKLNLQAGAPVKPTVKSEEGSESEDQSSQETPKRSLAAQLAEILAHVRAIEESSSV